MTSQFRVAGQEPRGKDLKWNPSAVYRDLAMAHSAFRNTKYMAETMDDEHAEEAADEVQLLVARIDADLLRIRELLADMVRIQQLVAAKAKEIDDNTDPA